MKSRLPVSFSFATSLLVLSSLPAAEELLLQESFETDGNGTRYTVIGGHDDAGDNYVARREIAGLGISGGPADGEWAFGFRDIDFAPIESRINGDQYPAEGLTVREARLKFEDIDVTGYGNIRVTLAAANLGGGNEPDDDLSIRVRFDSGDWIEIGGFKSPSTNTPPVYYAGSKSTLTRAEDENKLSAELTAWSWPVVGHCIGMELEITVAGNAGNEDFHIDAIRVFGETDLSFVTASFAEGTLTEPQSGGVENSLTLTLESPAPEGGATFSLTPSSVLSASSLDLPDESVTVPAGESSLEVPVSIVQDGRYTGTKTVDLIVQSEGYNPALARVRVENVSPRPDVLITEVLSMVPGLAETDLFGDANGDGSRAPGSDSFIEIMNFDEQVIDLSGWRIHEDVLPRHVFDEGTLLYPGQAAVVFGGGTPTGGFGGAVVTTYSSGLALVAINQFSTSFTLQAPFAAEVDSTPDLPLRADFLQITDALPENHAGHGVTASLHGLENAPTDPGAALDLPDNLHSTIEGAEERLFSPGTWFDGTVSTGTGWTRLPIVFTEIMYASGGGWFWDPTFGWLFSGAPEWDVPWVYVATLETFWFVYEASVTEDGMWIYDSGRAGWCYTAYGVYPWVWQHSLAEWVNWADGPQF